MTYLLAQTAGHAAEAGSFLTIGAAAIAALGTAVAAVIAAFRKGQASPRVRATLQEPVPEIPIKRVYSPPTYYQHHALEKRVERVENSVEQLRHDQQEQYRMLITAMQAGKDATMEKLDGVAVGIHRRIDQLLKLKTDSE